MTDWRLLDREGRAVLLAATVKITQSAKGWRVPSQSGRGHAPYTVNLDGDAPHCTCPDHELGGCVCKHILAVKIVQQRELFDDGSERVTQTVTVTETVRKSYPQNWKAYNAAQTTEKEKFQALLQELCEGIEEPRQTRGRPRIPLSDSVFSAVFKVYSTFSGTKAASAWSGNARQPATTEENIPRSKCELHTHRAPARSARDCNSSARWPRTAITSVTPAARKTPMHLSKAVLPASGSNGLNSAMREE